MHRLRKGSVGALALLAVLAPVFGACGGDDDDGGGGGEGTAETFCLARVDVEDRITELEGFDMSSAEDAPEARQRVVALIGALRAMLDAAPEEIRIDADTMASGLDDIESRIEAASPEELGTEAPALLAEIGGAGSDDVAEAVVAINSYAADNCD